MEKPSCISQLKELADSLSDRDINLKACMQLVRKVIHSDDLTDEQKVQEIKSICNKNGK